MPPHAESEKAERLRCVPLSPRDGLDPGSEYLGKKGPGKDGRRLPSNQVSDRLISEK
jgi:hypothetical protein